jgi:hypothetical protein
MKHGEGKDQARELYIYQQCTFDEIAQRIGRSDKTVREWASAENWCQQRETMLQTKIRVHEKLHTLVDKLADRMISDCNQEGTELSPQSLHALTNLITAMNSSYKYEAAKPDETAPGDQSQKATPDEIAAKVRELLGA